MIAHSRREIESCILTNSDKSTLMLLPSRDRRIGVNDDKKIGPSLVGPLVPTRLGRPPLVIRSDGNHAPRVVDAEERRCDGFRIGVVEVDVDGSVCACVRVE